MSERKVTLDINFHDSEAEDDISILTVKVGKAIKFFYTPDDFAIEKIMAGDYADLKGPFDSKKQAVEHYSQRAESQGEKEKGK